MNKITKYYELIQSLDSREWQALENYLTCFGSNHRAADKILVLARALRNSKECMSLSAVSRQVYRKEKFVALKKLVLRLKNRVFEIMNSDFILENPEKKNEQDADLALIRLKRMSLQYQRLVNTKPEMELRHELLEEIIHVARQYEKYEVLLEHLHLKKWFSYLHMNKKELREVKKEIEHYEKCRLNTIAAADYIHELKQAEEHTGKRNEEKINAFLQKSIPHLNSLYAETPCPYILYYLRSLELSYLLLKEEHTRARSKALELLDIIRTNKSVYKIQRTGIAYILIAICELNMHHFENALDQSRRSMDCFPKGHYNYVISKQYEFYALFFLNLYEHAETCAKEMIKLGRERAGDFRYEKFHYLHSCVLFKMKKYKEGLATLQYKTEIKGDKEGWEFSWRLLQIMSTIELGNEEKSSSLVKGLYQFMHDNKKKNSFSSRQKSIMTLLLLTERMGFDFLLMHDQPKMHLHIKKLRRPDKEHGWRMLTSEVIPFHEWFIAKLRLKSTQTLQN